MRIAKKPNGLLYEHSPGSISLFDHLLFVANVAGSGESSQLRRCRFALNRATEVDESAIFGDEESPSYVHTQGQVRLGHSSGYATLERQKPRTGCVPNEIVQY